MNTIWLVARREFTERLRDRTFLLSNALILAILVAATVIPSLLAGEPEPTRVGVVGAEAEALVDTAMLQQEAFDQELAPEPVDDRAAAEQAVRDGDLDLAVIDSRTVLVEQDLPPDLGALLTGAATDVRLGTALQDAGVPPEQVAQLTAPLRLTVDTVVGAEEGPDFGPSFLVALIGTVTLYGLLILYGQWVAQGIVEEKASRVIEVLVSSVPPTRLLAGKVLGLGALGLLQILLLALVGGGALLATGTLDLPAEAYGTVALVVAWFVLGYFLYATLFAVAGALVSRVEELQGTATPLYLLIIGAFFVAQFTAFNPDALASRVAGLVPFTAPLLQPLRMASGAAAAWEVVLAIVLTLATILLLIPLAARFYTGGVLRLGRRVRLSEAWRGAT